MAKITGTVKWFSNKKGFGFIAPTSSNSPTTEEIFVHQTSIFSDGDYRTLVEGSEVEFEIEKEESGKLKAINVTSPGGAAIKAPSRDRKRQPKKIKEESKPVESSDDGKGEEIATEAQGKADNKGKKTNPRKGRRRTPRGPKKTGYEGDVRETLEPRENMKKEREPPFHTVINEEERKLILSKGIDLGQKMTIDISYGDVRVKLGQGGYASLAQACGLVGEGTYKCNQKGLVTFDWERSLEFSGGKWVPSDKSKLLPSLSLPNDNVTDVKPDETPEGLWGADKTDPKESFIEHGFKMKRVVLARPANGRIRRYGRGGGRNGKSE